MSVTKIAPMGQATTAPLAEGNVVFTPARAGFVLRENGYIRNRNVAKSPAHVSTLAEIMRRGEWRPKDQIAFARKPDGSLTLVNGHHRMAAQAEAGVNVEWNVVIFDVANDAAIADLYTRFDTNVKVRTEGNILSAFNFAESQGLRANTAKGLYRAAPIIAAGLHAASGREKGATTDLYARRIATDRMEMMQKYVPEAREFEAATANAPVKVKTKLMSGGTMAVALVTLRADLSAAFAFWKGIADNDGLRRGDPRATYLTWMMENNAKAAPLNTNIFAAAKAWNYWVAGNDLKILKVSGAGLNIVGTTYWVSL